MARHSTGATLRRSTSCSTLPDNDLWDFVSGQQRPCDEPRLAAMVATLAGSLEPAQERTMDKNGKAT